MSYPNSKPIPPQKAAHRKLPFGRCQQASRENFTKNAPAAAPPEFLLGILFNGLLQGTLALLKSKEIGGANAKKKGSFAHSSSWDSFAIGNTVPSVDKAWLTVLSISSQKGLLRQLSSDRRSESYPPDNQILTGRRVFAHIKCKEIPLYDTCKSLENHLLVYLKDHLTTCISSSQRRGSNCPAASFCNYKFSGTLGKDGEAATLQMLSMSFLLQEHPSLSTRLAQKLLIGRKTLGRRKPSMLGFARVRGEPHMFGSSLSDCEIKSESTEAKSCSLLDGTSQDQARGSFMPAVSFKGIMYAIPLVVSAQQAYPDKQKLDSVQDFYQYTETEGRQLFEEMDRDKDGKVTLQDLKIAMSKMNLPSCYAQEFLRHTQTHWLAKSFGWNEFLTQIQRKEPLMLCLFNSLNMSKAGTIQKSHVKSLLRSVGLPATDGNATAMMDFLGVNKEGCIKYGQFRKFMMLLPTKQLNSDPWNVWFQSATTVSTTSKVVVSESAHSLPYANSALFSGLACQIDTVKVMISATPCTKSFSNFTGLGAKNAFLEWLTNHALRIGIVEDSKLSLGSAIPEISEVQPAAP